VEKFRDELEAEIEEARQRNFGNEAADVVTLGVADEFAGPLPVH
jgi:hypothetical protein